MERGEEVVLFDIAPRKERLNDLKDKVNVIQGDLKVWPELINAVKDNHIEGIFHHGSMLSLPSDLNPWASFQTNVVGTMHVLEASRLFGVKRIVFASSEATYGLGTTGIITEDTLQRPITMYGAGKLYCELLGRFYRRKFDLDFRCLRYFTILCPGSKVRTMPRFMGWMIEHATFGKFLNATSAKIRYNLLHITRMRSVPRLCFIMRPRNELKQYAIISPVFLRHRQLRI